MISKRSLVLAAALIACAQFIAVHGQTSRTASPDALVRDVSSTQPKTQSILSNTEPRSALQILRKEFGRHDLERRGEVQRRSWRDRRRSALRRAGHGDQAFRDCQATLRTRARHG